MRLRSLLWAVVLPLVVLLSLSSPASAAPISYVLSVYIVGAEDTDKGVGYGLGEWMNGILTFSDGLLDNDPDPAHSRFTDPNASLQMNFSGVLESLSTTLTGPMTADIHVYPEGTGWTLNIGGVNGSANLFYYGEPWQDDHFGNLTTMLPGKPVEFNYYHTPSSYVYGPTFWLDRVQPTSVPEPSTLAMFGVGMVVAGWWRSRTNRE